jgi:protoporphyrinogen oxidase
MDKIIIIGGGISGLSIANYLKNKYEVCVLEKESRPGGLIKCDRVDGVLYHTVGGHVFNSRRKDVLDWFWSFFNKENEFVKAYRNAVISMSDELLVGYPIENHIYMADKILAKDVIKDLLTINKQVKIEPQNFEEFLLGRFGKTLYEYYFRPYNEKIWKCDLKDIPLTWLEGKLPTPTIEEIIYNNFTHAKEINMVHSMFYYAKENGSQFLADRLAKEINVFYNFEVTHIEKADNKWKINGIEGDQIIFCGNIKDLPYLLKNVCDLNYSSEIHDLGYHGTTSVLCEIDENPYSWIYMPSNEHLSHRIICTGNFSYSNNAEKKMTGTVEFTDYLSKEDILDNLKKIPFSPRYIAHKYTEYTYPIQNKTTREMINKLKQTLEKENIYLLGRFAEWEYYNMDAAIGAAIDLSKTKL